MSEKLLSRVIMLPNGDVHIAFSDTHSIKCTSHNLFCFLSNPLGFIKKDQFKHTESTREVNPKKTSLEHIKGLTLIKVYDDLDIVCVFPKLFQALTNDASRKTDEILNLREYIYSADISDEKHLLLRFFCEFTNSRDETIKLNNYSKISENSHAEIMKETYDSFFLAYTKADSKKVITKNNPVPKEDIGELSQNSETETFEESTVISDELGENYISVADYAKLHNIKEGRVRGWLESKKIRDVKRVKEGKRTRVYINKHSHISWAKMKPCEKKTRSIFD